VEPPASRVFPEHNLVLLPAGLPDRTALEVLEFQASLEARLVLPPGEIQVLVQGPGQEQEEEVGLRLLAPMVRTTTTGSSISTRTR